MTQEEMLLEAAETEIMNMRNLERVLAREEEVKKKAVVQKAVYEGPTLRFHSRDGESRLEFINGASFGSELCTTSTPYPEKSVCVVTGLPAKYVFCTLICSFLNSCSFSLVCEVGASFHVYTITYFT
ncbi:unnamed protein product [Triticum turgidum subsp. durum]|uniref:Vps72/YL1 N-terminal domain-containing protein n=1 Tax=Triticum turgidum subsp. durum TaxID=4567 RepID=A0A9R1A374_TRITD|nr:unnamed protein product [Triticum turgidum subsp. durum]